jgi:hypothetical protein
MNATAHQSRIDASYESMRPVPPPDPYAASHAWIRDMREHPLTHQFHLLANHHRGEAHRLQATEDLDLRLSYATLITYHDGMTTAYEIATSMAMGA